MLEIIIPIFIVILVGILAKKIKLISEKTVEEINKVAYYIALTALVFKAVASQPVFEFFSIQMIVGYVLVLFVTLGVSAVIFYKIKENKKGVCIVQSYHANLGYMGLPIVALAFGERAAAQAGLILGIGLIFQLSLTTWILIHLNKTKKSENQLIKVLKNPLIIALVLGLFFSILSLELPMFVLGTLDLIARAALPLALIGVGASIDFSSLKENKFLASMVSFLKLVVSPILGIGIYMLLGVSKIDSRAAVLMLAMPAAVSTFLYVDKLGGDKKLASSVISLSTLISIPTLMAFIWILQ